MLIDIAKVDLPDRSGVTDDDGGRDCQYSEPIDELPVGGGIEHDDVDGSGMM